jgi:hypothetical protein
MAAIITEKFRKNNAKQIYDDIQSDSQVYYIGLGKNDPWVDDGNSLTYDVPVGSPYQATDVKLNLIAMKKVLKTDVQFVIPRVDYNSTKAYKVWDPGDSNCWYVEGTTLPCYAIVSGHLFLCVEKESTAGNATNTPDITAAIGLRPSGTPSDGYRWIRVQSNVNITSGSPISPLYSSKWYPIFKIASPNESLATRGKIIRIAVIQGKLDSAGYSNTSSIKIHGDGTNGLTCSATAVAGKLTSISLTDYGDSNNSGYTFANILDSSISGTHTVKAQTRVIVAPYGGFGYDNLSLFPTWYLGFPCTFNGTGLSDENDSQGWFINDAGSLTDYRQISLIRNPSFTRATPGNHITTLSRATYTGVTPLAGGFIVNGTTGARVYVDYVNTTLSKVYYHTSYSSYSITCEDLSNGTYTAYEPDGTTSIGSIVISNIVVPEYAKGSGDIIFYENRAPIVRNSAQAEDIKVVIQF